MYKCLHIWLFWQYKSEINLPATSLGDIKLHAYQRVRELHLEHMYT